MIYEKGDWVELEDSLEVPNDAAVCTVKLIRKVSNDAWQVECMDDPYGISNRGKTIEGEIFNVKEKHFTGTA